MRLVLHKVCSIINCGINRHRFLNGSYIDLHHIFFIQQNIFNFILFYLKILRIYLFFMKTKKNTNFKYNFWATFCKNCKSFNHI